MQAEWIRRPEAETAVVFVHGILSSGEACWRHTNGSYWPELLKNEPELGSLGIYVFTYQTGIFSGSYRLGDIVDALKEHLRLDGVLGHERLIFVCHSMGGIVVRKFILERASELIEAEKEIGLFLVSSPSLGSSYADWLSPLARLFGQRQAHVLRFVRDNDWLHDLDKEFNNLKEAGKLRIRGKELVEDKFVLLKKLWRRQVVEPFSGARYFGEPFKVPESDHFSIAKPENKGALQHRLLCQFIRDTLEASTRPRSRALVLVDVGVERHDEPSARAGVKMLAMKYVVRTQDGALSVEPDCDYLDAVRKGQPTKAFSYSPEPFPVCVPVLKIRILNNSSGQIVVNRVALTVERSCPTVEPLLVVVDHCRPGRCILVVNEGDGATGPCTMRYGLFPMTQTSRPDFSTLPHEVTTDGFDRSWLADLSAGLAAEGLDLQALDALKSAGGIMSAQGSWTRIQSGELLSDKARDDRMRQLCGEWLFPKARVIGCLDRRGDSRTAEPIFFESSVSFLEGTGYFPLSPKSSAWDLTLCAEGEQYEVAMPADDIVRSGESVELNMRVGALRPSRHRLSVHVMYDHDRVAWSRPLSLRIFVPRSSYDGQNWEWLYRS